MSRHASLDAFRDQIEGTVPKFENPRDAFHECAVCGQRRAHGSVLRPEGGHESDAMWLCDDCQYKLSRRIDDEDVKGG